MSNEPIALSRGAKFFPSWLRSREFIGPVSAMGCVQLMAAMDGPMAIFALPRIQSQLGLSDAGRSWVITAYMLTFGGLILLGGRLGDAIGRKRTFIVGVALFTVASLSCAVAWNEVALVLARLLQGAAAAIVAPTCFALVATTFPKGPMLNAATAVFGVMTSAGAVLGLVVGGLLTGVSWRLAFVINVPIGLLVIHLARTLLQETYKERMKLDALGALLATMSCTAAVLGLSLGPEKGWLSAAPVTLNLVALVALVAFAAVERTAENPIVPFSLFSDRNRVAIFAAMFLVRGVGFTLTVVIALYVQNIMGYTPLAAGVSFIPFTIAVAAGTVASSQMVTRISPRIIVVIGAVLLLVATLYGSRLNDGVPSFSNLLFPMAVGAIGLGIVSVPLGLSLIASVGPDRIGPTTAVALMLQSLGGPLVLVVIQVVITSRTLQLGGVIVPVAAMNEAQLTALHHGFTYGLLWLAGIAALLIAVAMVIGYTSQEVAHAQRIRKAMDPGAVGGP